MAELVSVIEEKISTDFAILLAGQTGAGDAAYSSIYATSGPGLIAMTCGHKYATVHARVELWSDQPPSVTDDWEDFDELPWQSVPGAGLLQLAGFDRPRSDDGVDLAAVDRGRVQVLAKGRHRYEYGDWIDESLDPEEWLIRLWPDASGWDGLAGRRRRLSQPLNLVGHGDHPFDHDLDHLLTWAPAQRLATSIAVVANALDAPPKAVLSSLRWLVEIDRMHIEPNCEDVDEHTPLLLTWGSRAPAYAVK